MVVNSVCMKKLLYLYCGKQWHFCKQTLPISTVHWLGQKRGRRSFLDQEPCKNITAMDIPKHTTYFYNTDSKITH